MFFFFVISLICFLISVLASALVGEPFYKVVLYYLLTGVFWIIYDSRRSAVHVIMAFANKPFPLIFPFVFVWPIFWFVRAWDNIQKRKRPNRFLVTDTNFSNPAFRNFSNRAVAIAFGRQEASRTGKNVYLHDAAKFRYKERAIRIKKELSNAMYVISPDGRIKRCFSIWR